MPNATLQALVRQFRRLAVPAGAGLSDTQLLHRFTETGDEAAFEVLVWRHGSMVLGTCRKLLGQEQNAEDAFQATFLTLARKSGSIVRRTALAGWLHQVASRIALRLRSRQANRREPQCDIDLSALASRSNDLVNVEELELWGVVAEELNCLPSRYRLPLIACYLEGKTQEEAARELNVPLGSMSHSLARGCALLRDRLLRRGACLSGSALLALLAPPASAALSSSLVLPTVAAALAFAAGVPQSNPSTILAYGVIHTMFWNNVKVVAGMILVAGMLVAGTGVLARHALTQPPINDLPANNLEQLADREAQEPRVEPDGARLQEKDKYGGIAPKVVTSWEKAGARFGWFVDVHLQGIVFTPERPADPKAVPGFSLVFSGLPKGGLTRLPGAAVPFGVDLQSTKVTDADLKGLGGMEQLQVLNLRENQVTDTGLKELAGLKQLRTLDLNGNLVTDEGLKELAGLQQLQSLRLRGTQVTDAGLKVLKGLKQLKYLALIRTQVTDDGLKELVGLEQLRYLNLGGTKVSAAAAAELRKALPQCNINFLEKGVRPPIQPQDNAKYGGIDPKVVAAWEKVGAKFGWFVDVPYQRTLFTPERPADPNAVPGFSLSSATLPKGGLATLPGAAVPFGVDWKSTKVTDADLKGLSGMEQLQVLNLRDNLVTDKGLKEVAGLKNLQTLELNFNQVTDAGLKELAGLQKLQSLRLRGARVTNDGLKELKALKQLKYLSLVETLVTDAGLKELVGLEQLRNLNLRFTTGVTAEGIAELRKALPQCTINGLPKRKPQ